MQPVIFRDRHTGLLVEERVYSGKFLPWAYSTRVGWWLMDLVLSRRFVSWFYGWLNKQHWSRHKIVPFIRRMAVDLNDVLTPLDQFRSFNDFIIRDIDLRRRPIDPSPNVCIAPADGRFLTYPRINATATFRIKHATFNLFRFLCNDDLARTFDGGAMAICRLALADYHHFHFPVAGVLRPPIKIRGRYFAVTPYAERRLQPFYAQNYRVLTLIESDLFGSVLMIEVGAFTVGSLRECYTPGAPVRRAQRKGLFELGGSIIVLLFEPGTIEFDDDLCASTRNGVETQVRLGESIGRAAS